MTLNVALGKYWTEHGQYLPTAWDAVDVGSRSLLAYMPAGICLDEIGDAHCNGYVNYLVEAGNAPGTVNRRLDHLSAVMNRARKKWGVEVSDISLSEHRMEAPENRTRWISPEEADTLIECAVEHLKNPIRFALFTGLRLSNITRLRWEQIKLKERVILLRVKSKLPGGKLLELPLSEAAYWFLIDLKPKEEGFVFLRHYKPNRKTGEQREPEPIIKFRNSFKTACKKAKIEDFRFHDLRHTAASWMRRAGVPIEVVQQILGHADIATTMKYAHIHSSEMQDGVNKLAAARIRHTEHQKEIA